MIFQHAELFWCVDFKILVIFFFFWQVASIIFNMSNSFEEKGEAFCNWLTSNGATISSSITLKDYRSEGAGRGVTANKDIKEGDLLFSLPRSILLSQLTSSLKDQVSELSELSGWSPLILCMMYEIEKPDSFWKPYFGKHLKKKKK